MQNEKKYRKTSSNSNSEQCDESKLLSPSRDSHLNECHLETEIPLTVDEKLQQPLPEEMAEEGSFKGPANALDNRPTHSDGMDIELSNHVDQCRSPKPTKCDQSIRTVSDLIDSPQDCSFENSHQDLTEHKDDCRAQLMEASDSRSPSCEDRFWYLLARYSHLLLVLLYGLFDGFAGVSAVLAVIPTLAMHRDQGRSAAYMGMFFLTSLSTMALLAAAWSRFAHRISSLAWVEFVFSIGASLVTVAFGVVWEVLLGLDLLDDVFG